VGHPNEDMDTWGRRGELERLEWSGSLNARIMSGNAPDNADGGDAIQMCLRQFRRLSS